MDSNHTGAKSPAKKRGGRSARRRSREFALQGVYQWLMSHTDPEAIDAAALEAEDFDKADQAFYRELLHGVTEEFPSLEASYAPRTSHSFDRYLRTQKHDHSLSRRDQRGSGTG